ncbi:ATP synthase subunit d, mitochondrial [Vitis vinifera]|uniref:ATP synthase subunit d, mitochondrial n=1 Tax=Vitis vinifera TaxID=29760 RepID=A0A438G851_VITVI|nr:ATP synthase subunit d, mitochondrial [Vitis vinifera]
MSGTGKKIVDVAFKASRTIDWDGMAKLIVTEEARKEFATLRRAFDEEPEPIDWEYYRRGIGSRLVDMYKEAYEIKMMFCKVKPHSSYASAFCFELKSLG